MAKTLYKYGLAIAMLVAALGVSNAQTINSDESYFDRNRNVSVLERPRPEYSAGGIRRGSFLFYPEVGIGLELNDNIFAAEDDNDSDIVLSLEPKLKFESTWSKHLLTGQFSINTKNYADNTNENVTDYSAGLDGKIDVNKGLVLSGGLRFDQATEKRTSSGAFVVSQKPINYSNAMSDLSFIWEKSRSRLTGRIYSETKNYDDSVLQNNAVTDQDFRDNTLISALIKAEYALSPDSSIFIRINEQSRDYTEPLVQSRDQTGTIIDAGVNFDIAKTLRGEFGLGHIDYEFESDLTPDFKGASIDASLEWFPTPLTTFKLDAARRVQPSAVQTSPSFVTTGGGISFDYDFKRNIILSAGLRKFKEDYQGLSRSDNREEVYAKATYFANKRIGLNFKVGQIKVDSSGFDRGSSFTENAATFELIYRV